MKHGNTQRARETRRAARQTFNRHEGNFRRDGYCVPSGYANMHARCRWGVPSRHAREACQEGWLAEHETWNEERAGAIIAAHAGQEGATLPILHALQAAFGYVPHAAVPMVALALNLTRAEVHGVVTFYHEYRRTPPGRHMLQLCRAEACQAVGAEALAAHVRNRLNVAWHETSADGAVTLEPVFCLGLCAIGPAALLDGEPLGRLTPPRIEAALGRLA